MITATYEVLLKRGEVVSQDPGKRSECAGVGARVFTLPDPVHAVAMGLMEEPTSARLVQAELLYFFNHFLCMLLRFDLNPYVSYDSGFIYEESHSPGGFPLALHTVGPYNFLVLVA